MAARNFSSWVPLPIDGEYVGTSGNPSAIMATASVQTMTSNALAVPRLVGADVGGGSALTEDTNDGDTVTMYDYLFNGKHTFDEAQVEDSVADEIKAANAAWQKKFFIAYDNAAIGVTGARSATASDKRPYTSIYKAVRTNDAGVGYTADANYTAATSANYTVLSNTLGKLENTEFWSEDETVALIHPGLRDAVRNIMGTDGRPIFVESTNGTAGGGARVSYSLFGHRAYFTHGAITSTSFARAVTGNKLVVFVNAGSMRRGDRVPPQARFIPAAINPTALEHTVQHRARQGFVLTVPQAASVVEITEA
jgi:hypothetical protein